MKDNTVVTACDKNYFWGAFLLAASMRMNGMDEPILVFQSGFTGEMKENLQRFGDVIIAEAPESKRNMTSRKGEAMLLAETDYVTWADCDGYFVGNCSAKLCRREPGVIHARLRSTADNALVYRNAGLYQPSDTIGEVPRQVLDVWCADVNERTSPRLHTCVSACYLSLERKQETFLRRWQDQMDSVLPNADGGVTDHDSVAYFQMDESVLNSLLFFLNEAPEVGDFLLDKDPKSMFLHMYSYPKPWQCWSPASYRCYYAQVMAIMRWSRDHGLIGLTPPATLNPAFPALHFCSRWWSYVLRARRKFNRIRNRRKKRTE